MRISIHALKTSLPSLRDYKIGLPSSVLHWWNVPAVPAVRAVRAVPAVPAVSLGIHHFDHLGGPYADARDSFWHWWSAELNAPLMYQLSYAELTLMHQLSIHRGTSVRPFERNGILDEFVHICPSR